MLRVVNAPVIADGRISWARALMFSDLAISAIEAWVPSHLFHHDELDLPRRVGPDITAFLADLDRVGVDVVAVGLVFLASPAGRKCARLLRK